MALKLVYFVPVIVRVTVGVVTFSGQRKEIDKISRGTHGCMSIVCVCLVYPKQTERRVGVKFVVFNNKRKRRNVSETAMWDKKYE